MFDAFITSEDQLPRLDQLAHLSRPPPTTLGLDTLQKSVMNAFSLKYSKYIPSPWQPSFHSVCNMRW